MLSDRTLAYSHEIAAAFLGADALYRQHPNGDSNGLVVMNLAGDRIQAETFGSLDEGLERFAELQRQAVTLPEVDRRLFYQQMCHTTMAILKWLRDGLPLADQIRDFLHLPGKPPTDAQLDDLRAQMHRVLNQMGYTGDLRAQCAAWEQKNRVQPEAVQEVMEELLDEGWERTARLIDLPAPKDDGMRVITLSADHFNARCDYVARTVEININPVITRPSLKHLVAHEAYPGHYVQFKLRETGYDSGTAPAEGLFSMLKSPSSCMFEGVADHGLHTLGWIEDDDDRLMSLMTHYRAAIAAAAAWRLHALAWDADQTTQWLRDASLIGGEGWVTQRIGYISPRQRGAHIWSYWHGEGILHDTWKRLPPERYKDFYRYLYGRLHSPQTVRMFV